MGNVIPIEESFTQTTILNDNKKEVPVVKIMLSLNTPVEDQTALRVVDPPIAGSPIRIPSLFVIKVCN